MQTFSTRLALLLGTLLLPLALWSQTISGTVLDEAGDPLIGVTVLVKGTSTGTITDLDGAYALTAEPGDMLRFSYIGYTTQEIAATSTEMSVILTADGVLLDDVVVIGYGETNREAVTGAISSVDAGEIQELTVANLGEAIQGRLAGVQVINQGAPGQDPVIEVRGIGSINFGTGPLIVVDGQPTGGLASFDSRDIKSVTVLKDASSTAIYGSRAANGVLLVETNRGKGVDGIRVNVEGNIGIQRQNRRYDLLNTDQYIAYADGFLDGGLTRDLDEETFPGSGVSYRQTNTDWQDEIAQTGIITQDNISVSGGNDRSNFYTSLGYLQQEGVVINTPFERYNFRLNSDHNLGGGFSIGQTLGLIYSERDIQTVTGQSIFTEALRQIPYLPVLDPENRGGFSGADQGVDSADPRNPVAGSELITNTDKNARLVGTVYGDFRFGELVPALDGLKFRALYGADANSFINDFQQPIYEATVTYSPNTIRQRRSQGFNPLLSAQLSYDRTFGDHTVGALLVGEEQTFRSQNISIQGNFPTNDFSTINGAEDIVGTTQLFTRVLQSALGRVSYNYQGKYLLSASARQDDNSALAPGNNSQTFFAGAVGWRLSEESFMDDSPFSELKLRASYGEVGNDFTNSYSFQSLIRQVSDAVTLSEDAQATIARITNPGNPELSWEVTEMLNVGVDMSFLNNRLNFTAEYYDRDVNNLIDNVTLAPSTGLGPTTANIGALTNSGFEVQSSYFSAPGSDFQWNVRVNLSRATNEVLRLADEGREIETNAQGAQTADFTSAITRVGDPIGSFYGFVYDGIIESEDDLANGPTQEDGTRVGDVRFRDIASLNEEGERVLVPDGQIDNLDRTIIGSYQPDFIYGINFNGSYQNLDLSLFFQGSQGNDIYNGAKALTFQTERLFNISQERFNDAWSPTNTDSNIPALNPQDDNDNTRTSDFFVEDGSYFRLKNVTLGYRVPLAGISDRASIRFYGSAQNVFTITGYSGLDPEIGGGVTARGFDNGVYPQGQTFIFGAQMAF